MPDITEPRRIEQGRRRDLPLARAEPCRLAPGRHRPKPAAAQRSLDALRHPEPAAVQHLVASEQRLDRRTGQRPRQAGAFAIRGRLAGLACILRHREAGQRPAGLDRPRTCRPASDMPASARRRIPRPPAADRQPALSADSRAASAPPDPPPARPASRRHRRALCQTEPRTHIRRPDHPRAHPLDDAHCPLHQVLVPRQLPFAQPEIILKPDARIPPRQDGRRHVGKLAAPDPEGAEGPALAARCSPSP